MGWFDWLLGKREPEPDPPVQRRMTEEELYDWLALQEQFQWAGVEREQQMMQAARERLRQRRAQ